MAQTLKLSKIEVARRQLDTAIRMYFHYDDDVSNHTLAHASLGVMMGLSKNNNKDIPNFRGEIIRLTKPEHKRFVITQLNEAANYFKHADLDPNREIVFRPESTEFVLIDACALYEGIVGKVSVLMFVYKIWWIMKNEDILSEAGRIWQRMFKDIGATVPDNRTEFLDEWCDSVEDYLCKAADISPP